MAEHTKLITIDPNGDTLLKLKDIRWELPQWIDEATRFAPPVDVTGLALEDTEAEVADEDDQRTEPEEVHFLVSSRQLRLVSTYFDAMFKRDFAESVADSTDGKYHIWATEWNPEALEWLMKVAHARSPGVRSYYNIDELVQMALIVDYYDIHELPYFYVKEKLALQRARREQRISSGNTPSLGHQAVKMLFLSVVFKEETLLEEMISLAMKFSKGPLQDLGLPLGEIPIKLEAHRQQAIKSIVDQLDTLIEHLSEGEECCSISCRATLLGTLILYKRSGGLSSALGGSISPPYYGTSIQKACDAVRAMTITKQGRHKNGH